MTESTDLRTDIRDTGVYRVTWEIDLEADSAEDAAIQALGIQRDPDSTATCFAVSKYLQRVVTRNPEGEVVNVDNALTGPLEIDLGDEC